MATDDSLLADINKLKEEIAKLSEPVEMEPGDHPLANNSKTSVPVATWPSGMKVRRSMKGHFGKIYALRWANDSKHLVSAAQDGKLFVWNAMSTNKIQAISLRSSWVMTCASSASGQLVASGGLDNTCSIFKLPDKDSGEPASNKAHVELAQHEGYLSCTQFVGDSEILTSSGDSTCILWDVETNTPKSVFSDHEADVMSISVKEDKNLFVSGSCDSTVRLWDFRTGSACLTTFRGHESDVNSVDFFPDGNAVGSGSDDSTCRVFDARACKQLSVYSDPKFLQGITSVAFSNSGRILFAGCDDNTCLAWDTLHGNNTSILHGHDNRVSCIGVSKDGKALATGSWDTFIKIWC